MKTKSGNHRVLHISELLPHFPDRKIPLEHEEALEGKEFIYIPSEWAPPRWDGLFFSQRRGYPHPYSKGFDSAQLALEDAERWEAEKQENEMKEDEFHHLFI